VDERRQVDSSHHWRLEHVTVEVELEAVERDTRREGRETAPGTVDDATWRVTEARPRAVEAVAGRQSARVDNTQEDSGCQHAAGTERRRRHHVM